MGVESVEFSGLVDESNSRGKETIHMMVGGGVLIESNLLLEGRVTKSPCSLWENPRYFKSSVTFPQSVMI